MSRSRRRPARPKTDMPSANRTPVADLEFSRPLPLSEIGDDPLEVEIEADAEECRAVATLLGVKEIKFLTAKLTVSRWLGDGVALRGDVHTSYVRECVVTLEHFQSDETCQLNVRYAPPGKIDFEIGEEGEVIVDAEAEDEPEPLVGNAVDLGEAVVQHLALTLDPYPRKPGVAFHWQDESKEGPAYGSEGPFADLAKLMKKN